MSRFHTPEVEESVACNLIPMIDIMFLLLLFFMLGADMSQRERADLVLPKADQVKEEDKAKLEGDTLTTINLQHSGEVPCAAHSAGGICRELDHWVYTIRSIDYTLKTLEPELALQAKLDPEEMTTGGKPLSKRKVLIRGDQNVPFGNVQLLMELCAKVGLYKLEVAAAQPEPL